MDTEFVNAYIERLVHEVTELIKTKMLRETQLELATKKVAQLTVEIEKLQTALNRKSAKTKEIETSVHTE